MPRRAIIVHGSYGNARENWFPWLAAELRALGFDVIVPDFPTPDGQTLKLWLSVFESSVGKLTPGTVLIGHSLGVAFILRVLERTRQTVSGCFLVCGFVGKLNLPRFDTVNVDFVDPPVDWRRIRENCGEVHVYGSDNDPYVPLSMVEELGRHLSVGVKVIKGAGHMNSAAGYLTFPNLLEDIRKHSGLG